MFGSIQSFLLVFLEDLHASSVLMGLATAMSTIAEIPMLMFSGSIIKKFGITRVLCFTTACYGIRFAGYVLLSLIDEPWAVIPIEALHGFTFVCFNPTCVYAAATQTRTHTHHDTYAPSPFYQGLLWACVTTYIYRMCPDELQGTALGLQSALYAGAGRGVLSLVGGRLFEIMGTSMFYLAPMALVPFCFLCIAFWHQDHKQRHSKI